MTDELSHSLSQILELAAEIQETETGPNKIPAGAIRYAVLKRVEKEMDLPFTVCYGQARAVAQTYGAEHEPIWDLAFGLSEASHTLFYIREHRDSDPADDAKPVLDKQMLAIGAQYLGTTTVVGSRGKHHLYLWRDDHPITTWLPGDE